MLHREIFVTVQPPTAFSWERGHLGRDFAGGTPTLPGVSERLQIFHTPP